MKSIAMMTMCLFTVVLATLVMSAQSASVADSKDACMDKVAKYLAKNTVPQSVQKLVSESRKSYPDFTVWLGSDAVKPTHQQALAEFVKKESCEDGCAKIEEIMEAMPSKVPCFKTLDVKIDDVAKATKNKKAKDVIEGGHVCELAY